MSSVVIYGDTSGAITLAANAVAGTNTITVPAQTGTMVVSGPTFSAYQSSGQTLSGSTPTLISLQTESWDTASAFNNTASTVGSTPAYAFLPLTAGYYQVNAALRIASSATEMLPFIYKNGSSVAIGTNSSSGQIQAIVSTLVYLNGSTDYIQFYAQVGTGQALSAGAANIYFNACFLRGA